MGKSNELTAEEIRQLVAAGLLKRVPARQPVETGEVEEFDGPEEQPDAPPTASEAEELAYPEDVADALRREEDQRQDPFAQTVESHSTKTAGVPSDAQSVTHPAQDVTMEVEQRPDPTMLFESAMTSTSSGAERKVSSQELQTDTSPTLLPAGVGASSADDSEEGEQSADPIQGAFQPSVPAPAGLARLATRVSSRVVGTPVAGMVPNPEQEHIIQAALELFGQVQLRHIDGQLCLVVMAGAGSGKTATCKMLEEILRGRGQYTAFNRPLVDEARPKFKKAKCSTTHQLAFHATGKQFSHRLNASRISSYEVARILGLEDYWATTSTPLEKGTTDWEVAIRNAGYTPESIPEDFKPVAMKRLKASYLAGQVMMATSRFCQSADRQLEAKHIKTVDGLDEKGSYENNNKLRTYLLPFVQKAWADLSAFDGQLRFSHDVYVKLWQLGVGTDRPVIAADYILLDEYQDTAPVFLDILMQQRHALLVMVGDDNQRIYEWRGAVNAGDYFPNAPRCMLSQSYRFGQTVADVANSVLAELEEPTQLRMRGNPTLPSRVVSAYEEMTNHRCYLFRTNAGALGRVMSSIEGGKRPYLSGGPSYVKEMIAWCQAAIDLKAGKGTQHSELGCFGSWQEVEEYSLTDEGADLRLMVKLIKTFTAEAIRDALRDMPEEDKADLVVSTAHKSKGREWDSVKLGSDFPTANKMTDSDRRLLYVAATRAKLTLDISECPSFCGGREFEGDPKSEWIPGLEIIYTVEMPTEEEQAEWIAIKDTKIAVKVTSLDPNNPGAKTVIASVEPVNGSSVEGTFGWYQFNNVWCVRGTPGVVIGSKVTVVKKSGVKSVEAVKGVVQKYHNAWIYTV